MNALQMSLFDDERAEDMIDEMPRQIQRRVIYEDIWALGKHRLQCSDATNPENVARLLQNEQYDLCFADPPYGIGIDEWDKPLENISGFIALIAEHLKPAGFFAFTHQMPKCLTWLKALEASELQYKEHIVWIKRSNTGAALPLLRGHESLFIYSKGKNNYFVTKGLYTDVKLPGVLVDAVSLEGIDRYIKDLQQKVAGRSTLRTGYQQKAHKTYSYMHYGNDRSPLEANFTNVWSFLPEHKSRKNGRPGKHATVKPISLIQRLITLCTGDNALIYDPFLGSGTTIIAAQAVGKRKVYGCEASPEYCDIILHRFESATGQTAALIQRTNKEVTL